MATVTQSPIPSSNPFEGVPAPDIPSPGDVEIPPFFRDLYLQMGEAMLGLIVENIGWILFLCGVFIAIGLGPRLVLLFRYGRGVTEERTSSQGSQTRWNL